MRAAGVPGERANLLRAARHRLLLTARTVLGEHEWENYHDAQRFRYGARGINVFFSLISPTETYPNHSRYGTHTRLL